MIASKLYAGAIKFLFARQVVTKSNFLFWTLQHLLVWQGVVTCISTMEAFATVIKNLDPQNCPWSLDFSFQSSRPLDLWGFRGQESSHGSLVWRTCVDCLIIDAQNSSWSLDQLLKWASIEWFHFDPSHKRFYRQHVLSDYHSSDPIMELD